MFKYSDDGQQDVIKRGCVAGGQVEIIKNADGTWTINYDLLDDQESPKAIRGTWTGVIEM